MIGTWFIDNRYISGQISTLNCTPALEVGGGENMVVSHTVATMPTMDTGHGKNRKNSDMDYGKSFNWKETNIIGIKGAGGGRREDE